MYFSEFRVLGKDIWIVNGKQNSFDLWRHNRVSSLCDSTLHSILHKPFDPKLVERNGTFEYIFCFWANSSIMWLTYLPNILCTNVHQNCNKNDYNFHFRFVFTNFVQVSLEEEFLDIPKEIVVKLLGSEELRVGMWKKVTNFWFRIGSMYLQTCAV